MALPEYFRTVCSECGWKKPADLQTDETPKEFWCFRCGKMVLPRVISLRITPAQRRLKRGVLHRYCHLHYHCAGCCITVTLRQKKTSGKHNASCRRSVGGLGRDERRDAGSIGSAQHQSEITNWSSSGGVSSDIARHAELTCVKELPRCRVRQAEIR